MNERQKFDLYQDEYRPSTGDPTGELEPMDRNTKLIYIDLSTPLHQMVSPVRELLSDKPIGYEFEIAFYIGFQVNPDVPLFLNYLYSVIEKQYSVRYYIRGIMHPNMMGLLLSENAFVEKSSKLLLKQNSYFDVMTSLLSSPAIFRSFIQRFIDSYNQYPSEAYLDVTELQSIGFTFKTF
jgi:hypothetical protein